MGYDDLVSMLDNFKGPDLEIIAGIVLKLADVKQTRWSGRISFEIMAKDGGFADAEVNRKEKIPFTRKRRVRSKGI